MKSWRERPFCILFTSKSLGQNWSKMPIDCYLQGPTTIDPICLRSHMPNSRSVCRSSSGPKWSGPGPYGPWDARFGVPKISAGRRWRHFSADCSLWFLHHLRSPEINGTTRRGFSTMKNRAPPILVQHLGTLGPNRPGSVQRCELNQCMWCDRSFCFYMNPWCWYIC